MMTTDNLLKSIYIYMFQMGSLLFSIWLPLVACSSAGIVYIWESISP